MARNGYAWWYIDALSDDGRYGLTIIAFIGSVFSPYYALARRRGRGEPENFVAVNVALYGKGVRRWTMTERDRSALHRSDAMLSIGSSSLHWDGNALIISIDEIAVPVPRRVKGRVRLIPACLPGHRFEIDAHGRHRWQPIAPIARVEAQFAHPALDWKGDAYFDHNHGDEPLESSFIRWDWSRQSTKSRARLLYDLSPRASPAEALAIEISSSGSVTHFEGPPHVKLPRSNWRVARGTRCDSGCNPSICSSLEDAPFYARSVIETSINGDATPSLHESLDLDRFSSPVTQAMLPFRMPRRSL